MPKSGSVDNEYVSQVLPQTIYRLRISYLIARIPPSRNLVILAAQHIHQARDQNAYSRGKPFERYMGRLHVPIQVWRSAYLL